MSDSKWLSSYLHYAEPFEPLLIDLIRPFVNKTLSHPGVQQFFFIRYWHRGPHIRLRFKVSNGDIYRELKEKLDESFREYVEKYPSKRKEPEWILSLEGQDKWFPNNSIQYVSYEPEIERYGGEKAIRIAEQHFQDSSEAILDILHESEDWNYEQAMGTAIQLHLSFAHAMAMDLSKAKHFFDYTFMSWFPRAFVKKSSELSKSELAEIRQETLSAFEKGFDSQKELLVPFCKDFWKMLTTNEQVPQRIQKWLNSTRRIAQELIKLQQGGDLVKPSWFAPRSEWGISIKDQERWNIYQSYVHMTNNRLGILNRDEGFLGFLIKESLKHLSKDL